MDCISILVCLSNSSFFTPLNLVRRVPVPFIFTAYSHNTNKNSSSLHWIELHWTKRKPRSIPWLAPNSITGWFPQKGIWEQVLKLKCMWWELPVHWRVRPGLGNEPPLPPNSIFAKRRQRKRTLTQLNKKKVVQNIFHTPQTSSVVFRMLFSDFLAKVRCLNFTRQNLRRLPFIKEEFYSNNYGWFNILTEVIHLTTSMSVSMFYYF